MPIDQAADERSRQQAQQSSEGVGECDRLAREFELLRDGASKKVEVTLGEWDW